MPTPDLQNLIDALADALADRLVERMQPPKDSKPARNATAPTPEWLTTKQAAKALNCSFQRTPAWQKPAAA